jgi:hypothetical protein
MCGVFVSYLYAVSKLLCTLHITLLSDVVRTVFELLCVLNNELLCMLFISCFESCTMSC